jgi:hypothetical protein
VLLAVDGAIRVVSSLVMKRDAVLSLVRLCHLRLWARPPRQIGVSRTGGKVGRTSGKVVFRKRGNASTDTVSVLLGRVVVRLVATRVE